MELAQIAGSQGNTPVGSVVVVDGVIRGEGIEQLPSGLMLTGRAEVIACQNAVESLGTRRLDGGMLYSTAEPCFMCSYAIRQSGIALVVYGAETPTIGGATSAFPILAASGLDAWKVAPAVIGGVLRSECERLRSR